MGSRVTIKDVARVAGVSISTVSRALNNRSTVNPELSRRVFEAANSLGYSPNEIARSLKRNNTSLIAYVVSNTADPFFTYISRGIEETLYLAGYNLINCSSSFSIEREQSFLRTLNERRVDGIIINSVGNNDETISALSQSVPIVLSNRSVQATSFIGDFVDFDNVSGMAALTNHLLSLGHRRIAITNGPIFLSTARERYCGFRDALRRAGVDMDGYPYCYNSEQSFSMEDGYIAAKTLMSMDEPPTAILASNSEMALGALRYFHENGIRIPEDVSLCCFGDILHHDLMYVDVTHTQMDLIGLGNRMADLLLERIKHENKITVNREIRFSTPFILGTSTAPPER